MEEMEMEEKAVAVGFARRGRCGFQPEEPYNKIQ